MKNAKRDITLNEKDSIEDMAQTERALFFAYARALFGAGRKETREMRWKGMERAAKNAFFLAEIATPAISETARATMPFTIPAL